MDGRKSYWQRHSFEIILVVVVFVLVAFVSERIYTRADLTAEKVFTLTDSTKGVLRNIDGIVNLKFFLSSDLPPDALPVAERIKDLLSEYEAIGGSRFRVQIIDPTNNPEAKKRAEELGIPEAQMQGMSRDELVVKKVFMGMALTYQDKSEIIPLVQNPANLEYDLTSRIIKLTRKSVPVLGIVDFSRSYDISDPENKSRFTIIKQELRDRFEVKDIKLEETLEVPEDVEALIFLQPMGLSDEAKYVLDQYLLRGGNIFAPSEAIMIGQQMQAFPALPGYDTVFKEYGLDLKKMMVLENRSNAMARFSTGIMIVQMPYPMWMKIKPAGFSKDFAPIAPLDSLVLPWSGYLSLQEDLPEGLKATPILKSTQDAYAIKSPFDLNPQQDWQAQRANAAKQGTFVLGYLLSGTFPSAFPDGPPAPDENASEERKQLISEKLGSITDLNESSEPGNLIVVSNGRFLEDNYLQNFQENLLFVENVADWMLENESLIGIRSRSVAARPFKVEPTEPVKNLIKFGLTIGLPLLVILFGLLRWGLRLKRRQYIKQRYMSGG
jgi:ABC-2 type transport system permease protein